eukprot:g47409.t1
MACVEYTHQHRPVGLNGLMIYFRYSENKSHNWACDPLLHSDLISILAAFFVDEQNAHTQEQVEVELKKEIEEHLKEEEEEEEKEEDETKEPDMQTVRPSTDSVTEHLHFVLYNQQHLLVANHFNTPSHSLGDMSILGLLQCHSDTTRKLEEQHLVCAPELAAPFAKLYQYSYNTGIYPTMWKIAQ